eukprot:COSAG01_NODE_6863_length_3465_cov_2.172608_2_plen_84_part_00
MLYVLVIWAADDIEQGITQSVAPLQVGGRRLIGMRVGDAIIPAALGPAWTVLLPAPRSYKYTQPMPQSKHSSVGALATCLLAY